MVMKFKFAWKELEPNYWWVLVAGHTLHVYQTSDLPQRWQARIVGYGTEIEHQVTDYATAEEVKEMLEHALMRIIGADALLIAASMTQTLIEKKWGMTSNNFLPLTFTSLLDALWSEMYIPTVGRCFVAESKTQWTWVVCMDSGQQTSGTCKSLHEAKTESVLAALTMHYRKSVTTDYDTLWMRVLRERPNA